MLAASTGLDSYRLRPEPELRPDDLDPDEDRELPPDGALLTLLPPSDRDTLRDPEEDRDDSEDRDTLPEDRDDPEDGRDDTAPEDREDRDDDRETSPDDLVDGADLPGS
jgi:hypothetical protein